MQKRKLQVFVSSTYKDLIEERQTAVQAILEAGHIPAGMELFIAGDESQWEIIKEWIDESDIYMLIIGGRYGSTEPHSNISYTQLEYEYAISVSKPHFVVIIDDNTTQKKAKKDGVKIIDFFDNSPLLKEFKDSIMKGKLVSICENSDKIESSIHKSINKLSQRDNLKGWVKADDTDYASISEQLARLSKENNELKSQLSEYNEEPIIGNKKASWWVIYLHSKKLVDTITHDEYTHGIIHHSLLGLFMIIGLSETKRATKHNISDSRLLVNLNLITSEGLLTEWGTLLLIYIESKKINWRDGNDKMIIDNE